MVKHKKITEVDNSEALLKDDIRPKRKYTKRNTNQEEYVENDINESLEINLNNSVIPEAKKNTYAKKKKKADEFNEKDTTQTFQLLLSENDLPLCYIKSNKYYNITKKKLDIKKYIKIRNKWMDDRIYRTSIDFYKRISSTPLSKVALLESTFTTFGLWIDELNMNLPAENKITIPKSILRVRVNNETVIEIDPFRCVNTSDDDSIDILFNACGSIWTSSFAPYSKSSKQYLSVGIESLGSGNPIEQKFYYIKELYDHPSLLQIWSTSETSNMNSFSLSYLIGFRNSGPIWQCDWCPTRFDYSKTNNVIGVISLILGNGKCVIIPAPVYKYSNHLWNCTEDIPIIDSNSLPNYVMSLQNNVVTAMVWNPHNHFQLCCGINDGSVAIFSIDFEYLLNNNTSSTQLLVPFIRLYDNSIDPFTCVYCLVKSVQYCPYNSSLIVSVGFDGIIKVWHTEKFFSPVYSKKVTGSGWLYDVKWDPFGKGLYYGASDNTNVTRNSLWNVDDFRVILYQHFSRQCGVWKLTILIEDNQSVIASISSDGTVRCGLVSLLSKPKAIGGIDKFLMQCIKINNVELSTDNKKVFIEINATIDEIYPSDCKEKNSLPKSKALAIQSLDSITINENNFICYGGACNLIRLHSIAVLETFVNLR